MQGGRLGRTALLNLTKLTLLNMILYSSENNTRSIRPFFRPFFVTAVLWMWSILHVSHSSEPVKRLDCQIWVKSPPPLTLLAGSAPGPGRMTRAKFFCNQVQNWRSLALTAALAAICESLNMVAVLSIFWLVYKQAVQLWYTKSGSAK